MTFRKYNIQKTLISALLSVLVLATACVEEDDGSDAVVPPLNPVLAFVEATVVEDFIEGDTTVVEVGWFSGVENTGNITVNFSYGGDISGTGSVVIPSGELTAPINLFTLGMTDDLIAQGPREVTITLTASDFPLNDSTINTFLPVSFEYTVIDDVLNFGFEESTVIVTEGDGEITLPVFFSGNGGFDEDITIVYEIDASSTAVDGVNYDLGQSTTFTVVVPADKLFAPTPVISIDLLDDLVDEGSDTLDITLNLLDVSGSDEVVFLDTLDNTITYRIVEDFKVFSWATDTLAIREAGDFEVEVAVTNKLLNTAFVDVVPDGALPAYIDVPGVSELVFEESESSEIFGFSVGTGAFTQSGDTTYVQFNLENPGSLNNDNEISINPGASVLTLQIIDPEEE